MIKGWEFQGWILTGDATDEEIERGIYLILRDNILDEIYLSEEEARNDSGPSSTVRNFNATVQVSLVPK